ncbi:MAG TPA: nucleotidyltransferase family protein [Longimicrobiales bacterium]
MDSSPRSSPAPVIDGIVPAAGRSRRMGRSKALLPVDGEVFIERAIRVLIEGGCRAVVAVVGAGDEEAGRRAEQTGAKVVVNPEPESDQAASLRLGLGAIEPEAEAVVVLPVDHPLVAATTVARLLAAFRARRAPIVRPTYCGVPGHPGVFARRLFPELLRPELPEGAHSVVEAHRDEVLDVAVHDAGTTADIDAPDDYRRLVEGAC